MADIDNQQPEDSGPLAPEALAALKADYLALTGGEHRNVFRDRAPAEQASPAVPHETVQEIVERVWRAHEFDDMHRYDHLPIREGAIAALKDMAADLVAEGERRGRETPTPAERAAVDGVARWGQQHPTEGPPLTAAEQAVDTALSEYYIVVADQILRDIVAKVRPVIAAEALREAADAMPIRSAMSRADADMWLHQRAGHLIHAAAGVASIPWRGAACEHLPAWRCDTHGECRACACGCGTTEQEARDA